MILIISKSEVTGVEVITLNRELVRRTGFQTNLYYLLTVRSSSSHTELLVVKFHLVKEGAIVIKCVNHVQLLCSSLKVTQLVEVGLRLQLRSPALEPILLTIVLHHLSRQALSAPLSYEFLTGKEGLTHFMRSQPFILPFQLVPSLSSGFMSQPLNYNKNSELALHFFFPSLVIIWG